MNRKLDLDLDLICELYRTGWGLEAIAQLFRVTRGAIRYRVHELAKQGRLVVRPRGGSNKLQLDEDLLRKLYTEGSGIRKIAAEFGVSPEVVRHRLHKLQSESLITVRAPGGWEGQNALEPDLTKTPQLVQVDALVLGDGCVSWYEPTSNYEVWFYSVTSELITFVKKTWEEIGLRSRTYPRSSWLSDRQQWVIVTSSKKYAMHIRELQMNLETLRAWAQDCERAFVAGLMDAEGSISSDGKGVQIKITNNRKELLGFTQELVAPWVETGITANKLTNYFTGKEAVTFHLYFKGKRTKVLEFLLTLPLIRLRPRVEELAAKYL